jgi:hypothetical protein
MYTEMRETYLIMLRLLIPKLYIQDLLFLLPNSLHSPNNYDVIIPAIVNITAKSFYDGCPTHFFEGERDE